MLQKIVGCFVFTLASMFTLSARADASPVTALHEGWSVQSGCKFQAEGEKITEYYRCQVKMVQAISMLKGPGALQALEELLVAWPGALVMVSHDRHLLQALQPTQVLQVSAEGWQWRDAL